MSYKRLKAISLKLDEKIKRELIRGQEQVEKNLNLKNIFTSRIRFTKIKIIYFGVLSFFVDIALAISEQIIAIFGDPAIAFNLLYNQHQSVSCPVPYSQFKKAQRHAKVFSYAGLATMVLMLSFSTMITNFLMGPTEKIAAAGYSLAQNTWTTLSSDIAHHSNGDGSGWIKYSAKTNMEAGETLTVEYPTDDWTETTDADFNSYTSKDASLSVTSNSIKLLKPNDAGCSADNECLSGVCSCGTDCQDSTKKADGEACSSASECCSGVCDGGTCGVKLVLYYSNSTYDGNLGGRSGADTKCRAGGYPSGFSTSNIRAFLSTSASDEIKDIPNKYGFPTNRKPYVWKSSSYTQIGNNWADLLDGFLTFESGINSSLVLTTCWWSGSTNSGAWYSSGNFNQCQGWTVDSPTAIYSHVGRDFDSYGAYSNIEKDNIAGCDTFCHRSNRLLCVGHR